jgi:hypothetical protein
MGPVQVWSALVCLHQNLVCYAQFSLLATSFLLVSWLAYSLTQKMESVHSSEMSVNFYWTTQLYIPEDSALPSHHHENLKSYT